MRRPIWVQITAVAALLGRVCAQLDSLPPCGVSCVNSVIAKGFGCASGDNTCLCKQQDFVFGVRDCASQSCGADEAPKINDYVTGLCASTACLNATCSQPVTFHTCGTANYASAGTLINPSTILPTGHNSSDQRWRNSRFIRAPKITTIGSIEQRSFRGCRGHSASDYHAHHSGKLPTLVWNEVVMKLTRSPMQSTSIKSVSSTVSKSTTSTSTGARASQSGSTSDAGAEQLTNDADGLSVPAKAGIGAAAGVGVLAIALALWLLIRRPRNQARSLQISGPMPGSGRDYTGGFVGMVQKNNSELELRSRRYEDMVPRQSPRHVI
ncbi:hypothetical protein EsH8_V_000917 [Colletotrichum jinshuiense]